MIRATKIYWKSLLTFIVISWILIIVISYGYSSIAQENVIDRVKYKELNQAQIDIVKKQNIVDESKSLPTGIYGYVWYVHAILTGAFVAYLPFSRMLHMIMAPISLAMNAAAQQHH